MSIPHLTFFIFLHVLSFSKPFVFLAECSVTKFLNRMLGLEVHKQNSLFQFFTDTFDYLIEKDKKDGKYDMGILGKMNALRSQVKLRNLFVQ